MISFRFDHNSSNQHFDPITKFAYSYEKTLEFLIFKDTCPCGQICMVKIALIPLKINEVNSSEELLLVGYPGSRIPRNRALPYSRIDPGTLFDTNGNQMKQSKGSIINLNNDLIAITNSSAGGMLGVQYSKKEKVILL